MPWPASLPEPLLQGYSFSFRRPVIRTEMETGPARTARTSTMYESVITARYFMDDAQYADFQNFYDGEANAGANWVDIPLSTGGDVVVHRCRFMAISVTAIQNLWNVVCTIEVDDRVLA